MGLDEQELWNLTPVHFSALVERKKKTSEITTAIQKRDDFRAGLIAATVHNVNVKKKSKMREPLDYFKEHKPKNNTPDKQKTAFMNWAKASGGAIRNVSNR